MGSALPALSFSSSPCLSAFLILHLFGTPPPPPPHPIPCPFLWALIPHFSLSLPSTPLSGCFSAPSLCKQSRSKISSFQIRPTQRVSGSRTISMEIMLATIIPGQRNLQIRVPQARNLLVCSHSGQGRESQTSGVFRFPQRPC